MRISGVGFGFGGDEVWLGLRAADPESFFNFFNFYFIFLVWIYDDDELGMDF